MPAHRRYIVMETMIAMVIAIAFSTGFTLMFFSGGAPIALWGDGGLAFDYVPQTLGILLPALLIPTLLTRKRLAAGRIAPRASRPFWLPRNLAARTLAVAAAGLCAAGFMVGFLALIWTGPLSLASVLMLKIAYGVALALAFMPSIMRAALADMPTGVTTQ